MRFTQPLRAGPACAPAWPGNPPGRPGPAGRHAPASPSNWGWRLRSAARPWRCDASRGWRCCPPATSWSGGPAAAGRAIYSSNRPLLRISCNAWAATCSTPVSLPDDLARTRERLAGLAGVDLILSTGGVSVGEADFLGMALREAGELTLWKLAIKPGKPRPSASSRASR
ncbi:molybdopterin-binding protein [Pseudomonas aeruginosa]